MATFGWTEGYVMWGLTSLKGWVWYNWAIENRASMFGVGVTMKTEGYVAQEAQAIRERKNKKK